VLVVDEDGDTLEKFRVVLGGKHVVLTAESARDALFRLTDGEVAAMVAEQALKSTTGLELCEEAARISPRTVAALMSEAPEPSLLINALNGRKVCYFLEKPLIPEKMYEFLDAAMRRYRARLRREEHLTFLRELIDYYKAEPVRGHPPETAGGGDVKGLEDMIRDFVSSRLPGHPPGEDEVVPSMRLARKLADMERKEIAAALEKAGGGKAMAARLLGINRSTLYYRMKKLGISYTSDK